MTAELYSPRPSVGTQGLEPLGHELEAEWLLRNGDVEVSVRTR